MCGDTQLAANPLLTVWKVVPGWPSSVKSARISRALLSSDVPCSWEKKPGITR